jgi:hypothetical protein
MINEQKMLEILADCAPGTLLFVNYVPGRGPSVGATVEAHRAVNDEGINPHHFTGTLESVKKTKSGQHIITLWVAERDTVTPEGVKKGNYRAFNPNLGTLKSLAVIQWMPKGCIRT